LDVEKLSARELYGKVLVQFGGQNKDIVVLTADLMLSNKTVEFARAFPQRFFNFGVAETNMMAAAAGFAISGKIPFVSTFSCFASMRCCEQIRTDIAYPNLPVKIVATHAGVSHGVGGTTHHATEDLAIMRSIANLTVVAPADAVQTGEAVKASIDYPGPVYIRIGRGRDPLVYQPGCEFEIGKAITLRPGNDATVIACGIAVWAARNAAEKLQAEGISLRVIDLHTIKPIDREAVINAALETGAIVTAEEHSVIGGLGGAVAEVLADESIGVSFKRIGFPDTYTCIGDPKEIMSRYEIDPDGIVKGVKEVLAKKSSLSKGASVNPHR
jgi:transketolase